MPQPGLDTLAHTAIARWGEAVRTAAPDDAIDGCSPGVVLEPPDVAMLADMLGWANAEHLTIVPRGGGTKLKWGATPARVDAVLSMASLRGPIDHCAGDLTATVPAGAPLAAVNEILGRERQWLGIDPLASDRATIGGIIATNDCGPRRHRYGAPRDLIIGVGMALANGRVAKAGGKVVKNVAGYDLARLLCGSFGSLAVITSATFKLSPVPPSSRTVVAIASHSQVLTDLALAIADAPLTPSAIEVQAPVPTLLVRFETTAGAADRQAAAARLLCRSRGVDAEIVSGEAETNAWRYHEDRLLPAGSTLLKIAVLPTQVGSLIEHIERVSARHAIGYVAGGRAALGVVMAALVGSEGNAAAPETIAAAIDELRQNAWARGGSVVVRSAAPEVRALVDPWGDVGDGLQAMRAVKARFDPNRTLNPGRGPGGI